MKYALAQINPIIGNFEYNLEKILDFTNKALTQNADIIVFPELALCGYPPKDLLLKKQFIEDHNKYVSLLCEKLNPKATLILGILEENLGEGKPLFNSIGVIKENKLIYTRQKILLPTYDVFDEDRYFEPGKIINPINLMSTNIGLSVCEDIWHNDISWARPRYKIDPIFELAKKDVSLIINSSASPYYIGKPQLREKVLKIAAIKNNLPIIYVNQVGGNDELIFDGNSCVVSKEGKIILRLKSFKEDLQIFDLDNIDKNSECTLDINQEEELLESIKLGLQDYISKCGFNKVILGLSGGIDSALVACLATFALGKENVLCVSMPSQFTSNESIRDAKTLTENLGIELKTIRITEIYNNFLKILACSNSLTKENLQARIRGLILMALSNETGSMVLATGNKSELATGYCTLYGDMCGGLGVISDLPKTLVYKLAKHINKTRKNIIPAYIIDRAPSAELKENQTDQDTLPQYDVLDMLINSYVEEHTPLKNIKDNKTIAFNTAKMIDRAEYKRKQAAPGLKLTNRSFGYGWRMPIAKKYEEKI